MATRTKVCDKVYIAKDGTETRHATADSQSLEFRFNGAETISVATKDFSKEMQVCALWHGFAQKLGDAYSGAKGDVKVAVEQFQEALESLKEGQWVTAREGGGARPSQIAEAYRRAMAIAGTELTIDQAVEKVKSWDDEKRKAAEAMPQIANQLAQIRLENAQKKAAAAADAAKDAGSDLGDL